MPNDPILNLIGLANKAGKLEIGEEPVGALCRARQAKLVLLAQDAAPNTCRRAAHFGEAGNVLFLQLPFAKAELGVADSGLAASMVEKLSARDPDRYGPAAAQLRQKADRVLQRQREKRQHEKNLREGKHKPWAAPPPQKAESEKRPPSPAKKRPAPKKPHPGPSAFKHPDGSARPTRSGPGGRRLSGKLRHDS